MALSRGQGMLIVGIPMRVDVMISSRKPDVTFRVKKLQISARPMLRGSLAMHWRANPLSNGKLCINLFVSKSIVKGVSLAAVRSAIALLESLCVDLVIPS